MQEDSKKNKPAKLASDTTGPRLRLVKNAEAPVEKAPATPPPSPSRLVNSLRQFADNLDKDIEFWEKL
jgi:hypothetical protein